MTSLIVSQVAPELPSAALPAASKTVNEPGEPTVPQSNGVQKEPEYLHFLSELHSVWKAPRMTVTFSDLSVTFPQPHRAKSTIDANGHVHVNVPNILSTMEHWGTLPIKMAGAKLGLVESPHLYALNHISGAILPGEMTLILAPPGHGKSSLLKAISGRLAGAEQTGDLRFNGKTMKELSDSGVQLRRLASYVGQLDLHFPVLTVRETLKFAADSSVPNADLLSEGGRDVKHLVELEKRRGDMLLEMIGLGECADVIVGSDQLRGVSGGQKKRVTLGEMMVTNARIIALDEVSTGLDAAVTASIFGSLRSQCRITGSSVVAALLQPTPETYELFDNILLLHEGRILYHGPRTEIKRWLWRVCGLDVPVDVDEASFLVDFLCDPEMAYESARLLAQTQSFVESTRQAREADEIRFDGQKEFKAEQNEANKVEEGVDASSLAAPVPSPNPSKHPELYNTYTTFTQRHGDTVGEGNDIVRFHLESDETNQAAQVIDEEEESENSETTRTQAARSLVPHAHGSAVAEITSQPRMEESSTPSPVSPEPKKSKKFGRRGMSHSTMGVKPIRDIHELRERVLHYNHTTGANTAVESALSKAEKMDPSAWSEYTRACFARENPHSYAQHLDLCFGRQFKLFKRNLPVLIPRMCKALSIGLFYGLLFFQLDKSAFVERLSISMYACLFSALTNLSELPMASEARNVIAKQITSGFFPASPYYLGVLTMHVPLTIVETACYSTLIYFIAGLEPDAGRFFFYCLVCMLTSNAMATFYRFVSYITRNPDVAKQLDLPFVVLFIILNGFIIVYSKIPAWLRYWAFWIAPLEWGTKSLTQNEFSAATYDGPAPGHPDRRLGDYYLDQFELPTDFVWRWMGPVYLIGWYILWSGICIIALKYLKMVSPIGSERPTYDQVAKSLPPIASPRSIAQVTSAVVTDPVELEMAQLPHPDDVLVPISSIAPKKNAAYQLSSLPFTPVTLSWSNLDYSVTLPTGEERSLLHDVNGFASPGEMTALMGASGAGKTTLMDVIAGRKTTGKVKADIRLNGVTVDVKTPYFQQLCGYCEQMDLHIGTSTVQEALRFSAHLRLPKSVSIEAQHKFVDEVMDLLALTPFANSLIGDAAIPGLAPAQLKLVTIGVELVANPSILFLDEPTSGLDAPAAWRVMTAIKRIALTGRNVLCTIHQPAARLFFLFDRLLLLKPGGKTIYFHSIGKRAEILTAYFEAGTKFKQLLPPGVNPANWMLDLSGSSSTIDWATHWNNSRLNREEVLPLIAKAVDPTTYTHLNTDLSAPHSSLYVSWMVRYIEVQKRLFISYWRNGPMNLTRAWIALIISLLLGIVYYKIRPSDYAGLNSTLAGLYMTLGFGPSLPTSAALPTLFRQRAVYYRESTVRMYDHVVYAISVAVAEFISMIVLMMIYIIPLYFLMDLVNNPTQFWRMYLILFLLSQIFASIAQFYLAYLPNQISASVVHSIVFSFLFVFGGFLVPTNAIPPGWRWFHHMISTPKAYIAVALSQLSCPSSSSLSGGMGCGMIEIPGFDAPVQVYEYVSTILENSVESYGNQVGWLILQIGVIKILTVIGFRYISHLKR